MRNKLDIKPKDKVEIIIRGDEIIIKSLPSFRRQKGIIAAKRGSARKAMERVVSKHIVSEGN